MGPAAILGSTCPSYHKVTDVTSGDDLLEAPTELKKAPCLKPPFYEEGRVRRGLGAVCSPRPLPGEAGAALAQHPRAHTGSPRSLGSPSFHQDVSHGGWTPAPSRSRWWAPHPPKLSRGPQESPCSLTRTLPCSTSSGALPGASLLVAPACQGAARDAGNGADSSPRASSQLSKAQRSQLPEHSQENQKSPAAGWRGSPDISR